MNCGSSAAIASCPNSDILEENHKQTVDQNDDNKAAQRMQVATPLLLLTPATEQQQQKDEEEDEKEEQQQQQQRSHNDHRQQLLIDDINTGAAGCSASLLLRRRRLSDFGGSFTITDEECWHANKHGILMKPSTTWYNCVLRLMKHSIRERNQLPSSSSILRKNTRPN